MHIKISPPGLFFYPSDEKIIKESTGNKSLLELSISNKKISFIQHLNKRDFLCQNDFQFNFMHRMEFKTAKSMTPTSAKIASQILAIPNAPIIKKMILIPKAKIMF